MLGQSERAPVKFGSSLNDSYRSALLLASFTPRHALPSSPLPRASSPAGRSASVARAVSEPAGPDWSSSPDRLPGSGRPTTARKPELRPVRVALFRALLGERVYFPSSSRVSRPAEYFFAGHSLTHSVRGPIIRLTLFGSKLTCVSVVKPSFHGTQHSCAHRR
jgi:hypothetical protein